MLSYGNTQINNIKVLLFFTLSANGFHFGGLANFGYVHYGPRQSDKTKKASDSLKLEALRGYFLEIEKGEGIEKVAMDSNLPGTYEDKKTIANVLYKQTKWNKIFDWSFGLYLGYRWALPQQWFLDWNFLDFSKGFSFFTNFRLGKIYSNRLSFYGSISPCVLMATDSLKIIEAYRKKDANKALKDLDYLVPFHGLGFGAGLGISYKISSGASFIAEYNLQISYFDIYSSEMLQKKLKNSMSEEDLKQYNEMLEPIIKPALSAEAIRHRISIGLEFHKANRDN
ncbi:MAG: hypothetical protein H6850_00460 [Alphaproteobacteria bacterium]|nr:MAG: hypothetical protein H6850_00460 [Alphaproteobacteria bacterium]